MLLYYVTDRTQFAGDESSRRESLLQKIAEATRCGVDLIQLREKDLSTRDLEELAKAAAALVRESAVPGKTKTALLINSRTDVAIACGADGVHLRSDDASPGDLRLIWKRSGLDRKPIVAVSCHSVEEVARAANEAADFAVIAPVFGKKSSAQTSALGLEVLRRACREKIRVLALGGITVENARACIDAGAAGVAGIRLFQENDMDEVVEKLRS